MNRIWLTLPDDCRQRTLITLSRVVIQQLTPQSQAPEVPHE